jgi:hypothetical protein
MWKLAKTQQIMLKEIHFIKVQKKHYCSHANVDELENTLTEAFQAIY